MRRSGLGVIAALGLLAAVFAALVFTVSGFRLPDPFHTGESSDERLPARSEQQLREALSFLAVDANVGLLVSEGPSEQHLWMLSPGQEAARVTLAGPVSGRWRVSKAPGGNMIAALGIGSDTGGTLLMGSPDRLGVIGTGVMSFAWHETEPALLAWISQVGTEHWLRVGYAGAVAPVVIDLAVISPTAELTAFGDWGFLMADEGRVIRFDPQGREIASTDGRVLSVGADGIVVLEVGGRIAATTLALEEQRTVDVPFPPGAATRHVVWMPGRRRLAVADVIAGEQPQTRVRLVGLDGIPTDETIIPLVTNRLVVAENESAIVFGGPERTEGSGTSRLSVWRPEEGATHSIVADDWLLPVAAG